MLILKNITDEEHKELLRAMLIEHYKEIVGPDISEKIPFSKIRNLLSVSRGKAEFDLNDIYGNNEFNTVAFGLFSEEISDYMGFALIDIRNCEIEQKLDTYGELYQLFIKPQYRNLFKKTFENGRGIDSLKQQLENYFRCHDVNEVIMMIPKNLEYLIQINRDLGFEIEKDTPEKLQTIYNF